MDAQHRYEISLKKDELFINLSSDDVYFISKQMDKWFRILLDDSYVPVSLPPRPQPVPELEPVPPAVTTPPPVVETPPQPMPQPVVQPEPVAQAPAVIPQPQPEPAPVPVAQPQPAEPVQPQPALVPAVAEIPAQSVQEPSQPVAAVDLPPVMQPVAQAAASQPVLSVVPAQSLPQPVAVGAPIETLKPQAPKDDFESVMDTVMRDLETPVELRQPAFAPEPVYTEPSRPAADLSLVSSLSDLCDQANAGTSEDYLLLASYYLNQMEFQDSFSLKRINSNLVKSGLTPVNHSILEAVLSKGYLSMVPDLTGTAEVSEYAITAEGLETVNRLF